MLRDKNGQPLEIGTYKCAAPDEDSNYIVGEEGEITMPLTQRAKNS